MLSRMIAASLGIGCVAWFPTLPLLSVLLVLFAVFVLLIYYPHRYLLLCGAMLLGLLWGVWFGHNVLNSQLPVRMQGQPVWVTGTVVGLPETRAFFAEGAENQGQRFDFRVQGQVCMDAKTLPLDCYEGINTVRVSWRGQLALKPGQQWRLLLILKRPHTLANPGGFDYQTWLLQNGIGAVGFVFTPAHANVKQTLLGDVSWSVDRWRFTALVKLKQSLLHCRYSALYNALLLGDKRGISAEQWQLFADTGTTHLMVISGLHVGLISMLVFVLVRLTLLLLYRRICSERVAALMAVLAAVVYSGAAGFSLPTQRALIMISVYMLGIISRREIRPAQGLVTALFFCLLIDPLAVVSASFWLSFSAVAVIFFGCVGRCSAFATGSAWQRVTRYSPWRAQYFVFIGLFPVLFIVMGQVTLLSPVANSIAVPLFSVLVVPGSLLAAIIGCWHESAAAFVWWVLESVLEYFFIFLRYVQQLGQSFLLTATIDDNNQTLHWRILQCIILVAVGTLLLLSPRGVPLRCLGVLLLLPVFLLKPKPLDYASVRVNVLDVGQGLAIVVTTQTHALVYDVGAAFAGQFSIASSVLLPFLQSQGIGVIDRLVLSHGDNDHAGGWRTLVDAVPVKSLDYGQWLQGFDSVNASPCLAGYRWQWDGVVFEYLHPPLVSAQSKAINGSANNASCVLKITSHETSFLLTGDIEREVEYGLINTHRSMLPAVVLIAPHHGSATSSSWPFIKTVNPQHVVVSSGYLNRFGHPKASIVARYKALNATVHTTNAHGAISFWVRKGQLLTVYHYRDSFQHYWL